MAKQIELTKQDKLNLINWAVNYYDNQKAEENKEEGIEITEINQPVDEQQLKDRLDEVIEKLKHVVKKLDRQVEPTRIEKYLDVIYGDIGLGVHTGMAAGATLTILAGLSFGNLLGNDKILITSGLTMLASLTLSVLASFITYQVYSKRINKKAAKTGLNMREYVLKKKLDKRLLKQAQKEGKDVTIEFGEDDYTYILLKQTLHELMQQQAEMQKSAEVAK